MTMLVQSDRRFGLKFICRSLLILLALYGLVFVIGDACLAHARAPVWMALAFAAGFAGLQYLIAPWIIAWFLDICWVGQKFPHASSTVMKAQPLGLNSRHADYPHEFAQLPSANRQFIERLCAERNIKVPRIGLILSGTPNAFSFGHVPGNARVVITTGLLEVLTPAEVNAVLGHEIGHIEHWDFAVMAIAALAPLLLYQLYVFTRRINKVRAVAYTAYLAYLVSQFVVLLLNRTREYFADHYAAAVTGEPDVLSSALVKIACGMVKAEGDAKRAAKESEPGELQRHRRLAGTLALMGISNVRSGEGLALGGSDPQQAAAVMRWDLSNPWARLFEMSSTHPLTALRVRAMNREAEAINHAPRYPLEAGKHIGWGRFLIQFFFWAAPIACFFLLILWVALDDWLTNHGVHVPSSAISYLAIFAGVTWVLRTFFRYRGDFKPTTIGNLIADVEVSEMHPRPVRLQGEILGRGVPGAFWSPDLVLRDSSGIVFLLYRQSIPLARLLFALTSADEYIGRKVTVEGWFRRTVRPYVEISRLTGAGGKTRRAYSRWVQYALGLAFAVGGWLSL